MKRKIMLFGRLRDAGSHVVVDLPARATARQALSALKAGLGSKARLLDGCVLATGDEILPATARVPARGTLAVLPPVCGG